MERLTLSSSLIIAQTTLDEGRTRAAKPLAVCVLDAGGHDLVVLRSDAASLFRPAIARAKAMGALGMGVNTRALADRAQSSPAFFASLSAVTDGQIALSPGGVLILDRHGEIMGAVGVSGDTPDIDEACALAGIHAAGLAADIVTSSEPSL